MTTQNNQLSAIESYAQQIADEAGNNTREAIKQTFESILESKMLEAQQIAMNQAQSYILEVGNQRRNSEREALVEQVLKVEQNYQLNDVQTMSLDFQATDFKASLQASRQEKTDMRFTPGSDEDDLRMITG